MAFVLEPHEHLDLESYFARTGYSGPAEPSLEVLEALCLRHVGAIPFENLDPLAGLPVKLDLASLQAKLVRARRGGYCFEHNLLFAAVLTRLGFPVTLRDARVRFGAPPERVTPRTHGALQVEVAGRSWLVDVGFGADGLLGPVPMDGEAVTRFGEEWRLAPGEGGRLLRARLQGTWQDHYVLQPSEVFPVDWVVANHYTSTHPDSRFVRVLTVQTTAPGRRLALRGRTWVERLDGAAAEREVEPEEIPRLVREVFGLEVPESISNTIIRNNT